ncbi:MAG: cation transporter [Anaerolineae bacterium]|jgi:divalent metal cation (Fe/Co/Zn/Cd) transporter|nr:cation transporter [Anaerolineae bacterium]MBT7070380.1 cation transporter [Anaerolineae bacterium]MBT7324422.1 cation transporter [Anaerolineae bacterium]
MEKKLYTRAFWLAILTVGYNLIEGVVAIYFGLEDETLALFGFGVDSFIEVLSGAGIIAMILRIRQNPDTERGEFEKTALRITGVSFYILAVGLTATVIVNLINGHKPETTTAGLIISAISIFTMWLLIRAKRNVGNQLNSAPILADANCTLVCMYMSLILLASSAIYALTGFGFVDSLGALGLVYFSYKEGKEAFEKAKGIECGCETV